jgi:hypothetical protein
VHVPAGGPGGAAGGQGGLDGGDSSQGGPGGAFPGSGEHDSGTDLIWLLRLDPGTATLADAEATLVGRAADALDARGFKLRSLAVLPLYGGAPIWTWMAGTDPGGTLYDALLARSAASSGAAPAACTTDALFAAGASLGALQGPGGPLFPSRPGALLVALVDPEARPLPLSAPRCGAPIDRLAGSELPSWARYPDGSMMPRSATRYLFAATSEAEAADALRARCRAAGLSAAQADVLAPSAAAFFDPLSAGLSARVDGLSLRADFCEGTTDGFAGGALASFVDAWATALEQASRP